MTYDELTLRLRRDGIPLAPGGVPGETEVLRHGVFLPGFVDGGEVSMDLLVGISEGVFHCMCRHPHFRNWTTAIRTMSYEDLVDHIYTYM